MKKSAKDWARSEDFKETLECLKSRYLHLNPKNGYVGYFEIPQEIAQALAAYIHYMEIRLMELGVNPHDYYETN